MERTAQLGTGIEPVQAVNDERPVLSIELGAVQID